MPLDTVLRPNTPPYNELQSDARDVLNVDVDTVAERV